MKSKILFKFIAGSKTTCCGGPLSRRFASLFSAHKCISEAFGSSVYYYCWFMKMRGNLSFSWRKCQYVVALSAINVVWGLCVVTRGI